jgi:hypothetical protein
LSAAGSFFVEVEGLCLVEGFFRLRGMTKILAGVMVLMVAAAFGGCATSERNKPLGPQSENDSKPWNRPQPGEGQGMFGGALQRR